MSEKREAERGYINVITLQEDTEKGATVVDLKVNIVELHPQPFIGCLSFS